MSDSRPSRQNPGRRGDTKLVGSGPSLGSVLRQLGVSTGAPEVQDDAPAGGPLPVADDAMRYEVGAVVGAGGMGSIHVGTDLNLRRKIALKVMRDQERARPHHLLRFVEEAQVAGQLEHPGIVPVHELGVDQDGKIYYTMKFIEGHTLTQLLKAHHGGDESELDASLDRLMEIFLRVCDAMAFAHSKGVIHRDLKPDNIMVGNYGEVLVLDWGLAKVMGREQERAAAAVSSVSSAREGSDGAYATMDGIIMGTAEYMPPEMAFGLSDRVGPRSDIYLLGAILFEICTGSAPHRADTMKKRLEAAQLNVIASHDEEDDLVRVALHAMATEPEDRPASVEELQEEVRQYRRHWESIELTARSRERLAAARESEDYEVYARALFGFRDALDMWPGNREAQADIPKAEVAYAQTALKHGDLDLAAGLLHEDVPEHREVLARVERARRTAASRRRRVRTLTAGTIALTALVVVVLAVATVMIRREMTRAVQAEKAAMREKNRAVEAEDAAVAARDRAVQAEAATRRQKEQAEAQAYLVAVDAANRALLEGDYTRARELLDRCAPRLRDWEWGFLDRRSRLPLTQFAGSRSRLGWVEFNPDTTRIVASSASEVAYCWDLQTREILWTAPIGLSPGNFFPASPRFHPDGTHVFLPQEWKHVRLYEQPPDKPVAEFLDTGWTGSLDATHDGRRLLVVSNRRVQVWNVDRRELIWNGPGVGCAIGAISADGAWVAFPGSAYHAAEMVIVRLADKYTRTIKLPGHCCSIDIMGRDRVAVGCGDGTLLVLELETGKVLFEEKTGDAGLLRVRMLEKDQCLLAGTHDGRVLGYNTWDFYKFVDIQAHPGPIAGVDADRRKQLLLTAGRETRLWSFTADDDGEVLHLPNSHRCFSLAWCPGSQTFAAGLSNGLWLIDAQTGKQRRVAGFEKELEWVREKVDVQDDAQPFVPHVEFSQDGRRLLVVAHFHKNSRRKGLWLLDIPTGRVLAMHTVQLNLNVGDEHVGRLLAPDGETAVILSGETGEPNDPRVVDLISGDERFRTGVLCGKACFSPCGRFIAGCSGSGEPIIWDAKSGERLHTLPPLGSRHSDIVFSPDGTVLATAYMTVTFLWDSATGKELLRLEGHRDAITDVAFHPRGHRIVTASRDSTWRLWDAQIGRCLLTMPLPYGSAASLDWSADGRILAVGESGARGYALQLWRSDIASAPGEAGAGEQRDTDARTDTD